MKIGKLKTSNRIIVAAMPLLLSSPLYAANLVTSEDSAILYETGGSKASLRVAHSISAAASTSGDNGSKNNAESLFNVAFNANISGLVVNTSIAEISAFGVTEEKGGSLTSVAEKVVVRIGSSVIDERENRNIGTPQVSVDRVISREFIRKSGSIGFNKLGLNVSAPYNFKVMGTLEASNKVKHAINNVNQGKESYLEASLGLDANLIASASGRIDLDDFGSKRVTVTLGDTRLLTGGASQRAIAKSRTHANEKNARTLNVDTLVGANLLTEPGRLKVEGRAPVLGLPTTATVDVDLWNGRNFNKPDAFNENKQEFSGTGQSDQTLDNSIGKLSNLNIIHYDSGEGESYTVIAPLGSSASTSSSSLFTHNTADSVFSFANWTNPAGTRTRAEYRYNNNGEWKLGNVYSSNTSQPLCLTSKRISVFDPAYCKQNFPSVAGGKIYYRFRVEKDNKYSSWQYIPPITLDYDS